MLPFFCMKPTVVLPPRCATSLATVITWLEMHRGTVRAAAVTVPQESVRTEWSRPSVLQRQPAPSRNAPQTGGPQSCPPPWLLHTAGGPCKAAWCPLEPRPVMLRGMAAPRPRLLGSAVLRYCWDRVCALPLQQVEMLVRHTVRAAFAAILTAVRTVCACVTPGEWNMDGPFTPCAPESAIRDCLPGVAPDPGGVSSAFMRRLAPAARSSH
ncbi:trans-sialidase [Trypanosoma cruzi]|nr:trans-sialidase [Trypanosoma cruzi]